MIFDMEKAMKDILTVTNTKVTSKAARRMVRVYISGQMVRSMMASGATE